MPNTITETKTIAELTYPASSYRLHVDHDVKQVASIARKRVTAFITFAGGGSQQVRMDEPMVWEHDVPTKEELLEASIASAMFTLKNKVENGREYFEKAKSRLNKAMDHGAFAVTYSELQELTGAIAELKVCELVDKVLENDEFSDEEKIQRLVDVATERLLEWRIERSTSAISNAMSAEDHDAWCNFYRTLSRTGFKPRFER